MFNVFLKAKIINKKALPGYRAFLLILTNRCESKTDFFRGELVVNFSHVITYLLIQKPGINSGHIY